MAQQPVVGHGHLIIEASRSISVTPHSVGLLWTSVPLEAEISNWQNTAITRDRRPSPRRDSKPQTQQARGYRGGLTWAIFKNFLYNEGSEWLWSGNYVLHKIRVNLMQQKDTEMSKCTILECKLLPIFPLYYFLIQNSQPSPRKFYSFFRYRKCEISSYSGSGHESVCACGPIRIGFRPWEWLYLWAYKSRIQAMRVAVPVGLWE